MNPDPPADRGETSAHATESCVAGNYAYPSDLAGLVLTRWHEAIATGQITLPALDISTLARVLSICYQATLLREEGRPVTFRLAISGPEAFDPAAGPPSGLHRLVFSRPLPLDQHELRRLAPAAVFSQSLIGATLSGATGAEIWGVIHSGPQWLQSVRGGRETEQTIPPVLIVAATGPGRLLVSVGAVTLAELRNGTLSDREMDVFTSQWMQQRLAEVSALQRAAHARVREKVDERWADVDPTFGAVLAGHVLRRVLATIRSAQHGGMLIVVPGRRVSELLSDGRYVRVKYGFTDEEPRRRILTLMVSITNELARGGAGGAAVGWDAYEASRGRQLSKMDEALFEVAHLVAGLTHVDGTVLMTDCLEILGFGVEIAGELPEVLRVARAQDLEGTEREWVRTDRVGTRHRSAYRLCQAVHDTLAIVVSQDGGLRFIRWHDDGVTYWEQVATGLWDV
jgi:sensor domain DACNV-containing protein